MRDADNKKAPVSPGDLVAGKYRVDRVLGTGGMGVVVAATHIELDQKVALKFILPAALGGDPNTPNSPSDGVGAVERFLREARAVVRLKSEHVARVFDVGKLESGAPFIVMELLEGSDLAKLNSKQGPFTVPDAVEYVLQACEALVEAHGMGIVHRDLKPQNLFVSKRLNGSPLVKVLDFGISKAIGPAAVGQLDLTDSTVVLGSPLYMSPEQMRSAKAADARSDLWALGVILFELLAGCRPFDGETVTELCLKVVNEPAPDITGFRKDIPPALVAIVARCLEKAPERRFASVAMLADALEPFSRSAERGTVDRPWRSFVDTLDQKDSGEIARAISDNDKLGTNVTWGEASEGGPLRLKKKRTFVGGVAAGLGVAILAGAAAFAIAARRPAQVTASPGLGDGGASIAQAHPAASPPLPSAALPSIPVESLSVAAPSTAVTSPRAKPAPRASGSSASPSGGGAGGGAPPVPAPPPASPPSASPTQIAPNGAPILR